MENSADNPLKVLKEQITEYINLRSEQTRLSAIESAAKIAAHTVSTFIVIILVLLCLLSLVVACSFFIGRWLHNYGLGFLLSAGFYLLLIVLYAYIIRKKSETSVMNKIIQLTNSHEEE